MNPLLEVFLKDGFLPNTAGIAGLGLIALAAAHLAKSEKSWGHITMAVGASCLLLARLYFMVAPHVMTHDFLIAIGPLGISATYALPPLLLTFGLAGVVSGLWEHDRRLTARAR